MVITFLPYGEKKNYRGFKKSAKVLDDKRLNKQIVEIVQIHNSLISLAKGEKSGWQNHPATQMWRGYEDALIVYHNILVDEFNSRPSTSRKREPIEMDLSGAKLPPWFGSPLVHFSHQSSLIRKHPAHYETIFTDLPNVYRDLGYLWPSNYAVEEDQDKKKVPKVYYEELTDEDPENPRRELFAKVNNATAASSHLSEYSMYSVAQLREEATRRGVSHKKMSKKELYLILKKDMTLEEARKVIESGFFLKKGKKKDEKKTSPDKNDAEIETYTRDGLMTFNLVKLREICKSKKIRNYSKMRKAELADAILAQT